MMTLYEKLMEALPELTASDFLPSTGTILLRDDSDGAGAYIAEWAYSKPIPDGLTLGK